MNLVDHQKLILFHLLNDHSCLSNTCEYIRPEMFQDKALRGIYVAIVRGSYERQFPFTPTTLIDTISARPGNAEKRKELIDLIYGLGTYADTTEVDLSHSMTQVQRGYKHVRMCEAAALALKELQNGNVENGERAFFSVLDDIQDVGRDRVLRNLADTADDAFKLYEQTAKTKKPPGLPCGFSRIDKVTGGFKPGRVWFWAAYTSHGKTHCAKEVSYHVASKGGRVLFISLEMEFAEVEMLFHVRHANSFGTLIQTKDVENGRLTPRQREVYKKAVNDFKQMDLTIWVPGRVTMAEIQRRISAMQVTQKLDLVVIDYLQLVKAAERRFNGQEELKETVRETKYIARRESVPLLCLHQMSREGWKEAEKRGFYVNSDLAESAEVERAADVVVWNLYTPDMEKNHEIKIGVCKNRGGGKLFEGYFLYAGMSHSLIAERKEQTGTEYLDELST